MESFSAASSELFMKIEVYAFIEGFISDMEKAGATEEEPGKWVCRNNFNEIHRDDGPAVLIVSNNSISKRHFHNGRFVLEAYMLV